MKIREIIPLLFTYYIYHMHNKGDFMYSGRSYKRKWLMATLSYGFNYPRNFTIQNFKKIEIFSLKILNFFS